MSTYGWEGKAELEAAAHLQSWWTKTSKNNSTRWLTRGEQLHNKCSQVVAELTSIKTRWEYRIAPWWIWEGSKTTSWASLITNRYLIICKCLKWPSRIIKEFNKINNLIWWCKVPLERTSFLQVGLRWIKLEWIRWQGQTDLAMDSQGQQQRKLLQLTW